MKTLLIAIWLSFGAITALAGDGNDQGQNNNDQGGAHHAAPAPLLGAGIPAALVIGGVLLGAKLLKRKR